MVKNKGENYVKENRKIRVKNDQKEKEFIQNKAKELGFRSVSDFLIESVYTHFRLELDMGVYRKLTSEINYIGRNINSLVRRINANEEIILFRSSKNAAPFLISIKGK